MHAVYLPEVGVAGRIMPWHVYMKLHYSPIIIPAQGCILSFSGVSCSADSPRDIQHRESNLRCCPTTLGTSVGRRIIAYAPLDLSLSHNLGKESLVRGDISRSAGLDFLLMFSKPARNCGQDDGAGCVADDDSAVTPSSERKMDCNPRASICRPKIW